MGNVENKGWKKEEVRYSLFSWKTISPLSVKKHVQTHDGVKKKGRQFIPDCRAKIPTQFLPPKKRHHPHSQKKREERRGKEGVWVL